jgi:hypothetical protein
MKLASSGYPILDAMWTIFIFFGWVMFIWLLFVVYTDVFRRHDIGGWAKAGWVIFTLFLPFIGVFTYLIVEGRSMKERQRQDMQQAQADLDAHIRTVAGGSDGIGTATDQIAQAKHLLDTGAISPEEYDKLKKKALVG